MWVFCPHTNSSIAALQEHKPLSFLVQILTIWYKAWYSLHGENIQCLKLRQSHRAAVRIWHKNKNKSVNLTAKWINCCMFGFCMKYEYKNRCFSQELAPELAQSINGLFCFWSTSSFPYLYKGFNMYNISYK